MRRNYRPDKRWLSRGLVGAMLFLSVTTHGADNVRFHGELVAEPCVIPPGEENIQLNFGTVIDQYLYLNQRTHGQQFELHLTECDLSVANSVRVTFSGKENLNLPGLLALDAASQATGIAIGMETLAGKLLPLNLAGQKYPLAKDSNLITFKVYVKGEPQAITHQSIKHGPFSAVATLSLEYE
ncbi:exported pilin protein [Yersinia intermedia]|uniref:fimbrial protein n=1 Tax=Yersinia intermedia TaxID=631 RepID=UPI0005DC1C94|nr:exported pilin protein [Yersinia intermedia]CNG59035.1 exported pilin protein [Yersinia intermedia]